MPFEQIIRALERTFQCRICIHDHTKMLGALTGTGFGTHLDPFCTLIKKKEDYKFHRCMQCDINYLQQTLGRTRAPLLKHCHMRVCEAVIPVLDNDRLIATIFAGPFRVELSAFTASALVEPSPFSRPNRREAELRNTLPLLTPDKAADCLQLCGLLAGHLAARARASGTAAGTGISRRERIARFINAHYMRPVGLSDLAAHLGLSVSRTTQVVKKEFGKTFPALITAARIEQACTLLSRSHFSATQIARFSGFGYQAYFHRVFKQHTGQTPLAFRKAHFRVQVP